MEQQVRIFRPTILFCGCQNPDSLFQNLDLFSGLFLWTKEEIEVKCRVRPLKTCGRTNGKRQKFIQQAMALLFCWGTASVVFSKVCTQANCAEQNRDPGLDSSRKFLHETICTELRISTSSALFISVRKRRVFHCLRSLSSVFVRLLWRREQSGRLSANCCRGSTTQWLGTSHRTQRRWMSGFLPQVKTRTLAVVFLKILNFSCV